MYFVSAQTLDGVHYSFYTETHPLIWAHSRARVPTITFYDKLDDELAKQLLEAGIKPVD